MQYVTPSVVHVLLLSRVRCAGFLMRGCSFLSRSDATEQDSRRQPADGRSLLPAAQVPMRPSILVVRLPGGLGLCVHCGDTGADRRL